MAVFTDVSPEQAQALLDTLNLGELQSLKGITAGIENTNYFVTTTRDGERHEYVLTIFERLSFEQLPFYLELVRHLARRGVPVPTRRRCSLSATMSGSQCTRTLRRPSSN